METNRIAWGRIFFFCFALSCAICSFIWGKCLIHKNQEAINVIVTIFSVFAGFMVGLIALTADPANISKRNSWQFAQLWKPTVKNRIIRQLLLFELYLLTLALIFITILFKNTFGWIQWVERAWLALAVLAFILSFSIPWSISKIQMERYDKTIEEQRKQANILEQPSQ